MRIYLAGPLWSDAEKSWNAGLAMYLRGWDHEVFVPQDQEQKLAEPGDASRVFLADLAGLNAAEVVVAAVDGADVDSGTAWEIGYAYAKGIPVFALRTDHRRFGPIERINCMVQESSRVYSDYKELEQAIRTYVRPQTIETPWVEEG